MVAESYVLVMEEFVLVMEESVDLKRYVPFFYTAKGPSEGSY